VVIGYRSYIALIEPLCAGRKVIANGMGRERGRCRQALEYFQKGKTVAVVSGGDSGVYGMAGLVLEIAQEAGIDAQELIEIVPGVPAFAAAAARVGAPVMHDFACISLSDLLTPWDKIEKRLRAAAEADFVACLYNPRSTQRVKHIVLARDIFCEHRSPQTPCALVRNAFRENEEVCICSLENMADHDIDMRSIVIIGNSETYTFGKWMITPRGYEWKSALCGI
jgi:precorrin-3B C17-methyltransferase